MELLEREDITYCLADARAWVPPFIPPKLFVHLEGFLSRVLNLLPRQDGLREVPNVFVGDLRLRVKDWWYKSVLGESIQKGLVPWLDFFFGLLGDLNVDELEMTRGNQICWGKPNCFPALFFLLIRITRLRLRFLWGWRVLLTEAERVPDSIKEDYLLRLHVE